MACTLLSLSVKLPATLVLDLSSPNAIDTFLSWLPWVLASIPDERHTRPLHVHLCFKYDAVLGTKDHRLWSDLKDILAEHPLARIAIESLDAIDNVPYSVLNVLLTGLMRRAREKLSLI